MPPLPSATRLLAALALLLAARPGLTGDAPSSFAPVPAPPAMSLRVATFNSSLYSETPGGLVARLQAGDVDAGKVAAVIQHLRPDLLVLNEFDHDEAGQAADLFQRRYLEVSQHGQEPIRYDYRYLAPVNTGVPSGLDLDRNGRLGGTGRDLGNDAWAYGLHPGQYGMLVLSRHPIDAAAARSFRLLPWSAMPGARAPRDPATGAAWYPPEVWAQLRLSSKSHWDLPVDTPLGRLHLLVSHPTPPVFDGPENRNGERNADELRLWRDYLTAGDLPWLCDDNGRCGGLPEGERFVIAGDLNNDPVDGAGHPEAIIGLLEHPRVLRYPAPTSRGGGAQAATPRTSTFGLRVDYVLPSVGLSVLGSGLFWPEAGEVGAEWLDATDHRMVWVDLALGQ